MRTPFFFGLVRDIGDTQPIENENVAKVKNSFDFSVEKISTKSSKTLAHFEEFSFQRSRPSSIRLPESLLIIKHFLVSRINKQEVSFRNFLYKTANLLFESYKRLC